MRRKLSTEAPKPRKAPLRPQDHFSSDSEEEEEKKPVKQVKRRKRKQSNEKVYLYLQSVLKVVDFSQIFETLETLV